MTAATSVEETVERISRCIMRHSFLHADEDALQAGIAEALDQAGFAAEREVRLSDRDRIDLLVGDVGVEVKTNGTSIAAFRQCQRYAHSPRVAALILVTTRAAHTDLPATVGGKPLTVLPLLGRF